MENNLFDLPKENQAHFMVAVGGGNVQRRSAFRVLVLQQLRRPANSPIGREDFDRVALTEEYQSRLFE